MSRDHRAFAEELRADARVLCDMADALQLRAAEQDALADAAERDSVILRMRDRYRRDMSIEEYERFLAGAPDAPALTREAERTAAFHEALG